MTSDEGSKIWAPLTVVGCVLALFLIVCCIVSHHNRSDARFSVERIRLPRDARPRPRPGPPRLVATPSPHLPTDQPLVETERYREHRRDPQGRPPQIERPDPAQVRGGPRGRVIRGGPQAPGARPGDYGDVNIIEREPVFR